MAFKMNYNRDSFPYKTDERVKDDLINIRKNERPTEQGPTKMEDGYTMKTPYEKNKYSHNTMKTPYEKHGGTKPQSQMTADELAKHKGIKKPQSQVIPQGDFEPMFMGGDISKEEFDKMSKEEQEEYMEKYAAD